MKKIVLNFIACFFLVFTDLKAENVATIFKDIASDYSCATDFKDRFYLAEKILNKETLAATEKLALLKLQSSMSKKLQNDVKTQQALFLQLLANIREEKVFEEVSCYKNLLQFFGRYGNHFFKTNFKHAIVPAHVFSDMKYYMGSENSPMDTVLERVFRPVLQTRSGLACAALQARQPMASSTDIQAKQKRILWLKDHPDQAQQLNLILSEIADIEKEFFDASNSCKKINLSEWTFSQDHVPVKIPQAFINLINKCGDSNTAMMLLAITKIIPPGLVYAMIKRTLYHPPKLKNISSGIAFAQEAVLGLIPDNPRLNALRSGIERLFQTVSPYISQAGTKAYKAGAYVAEEAYRAEKAFESFVSEHSPEPIRESIRITRDFSTEAAHQAKIITSLFNSSLNFIAKHKDPIMTAINTLFVLHTLNKIFVEVPKLLQQLENTQKSLIKIKRLNSLALKLKKFLPAEIFCEINFIENFCAKKQDLKLKSLLKSLDSRTFSSEAGKYSHYGRIAQTYKMFQTQKGKFIDLFVALGQLDCDFACAKLIGAQDPSGNQFCIAQAIEATTPSIKCSGVWGTLIDRSGSIKNNMLLGPCNNKYLPAAVLSGPNAAGKSVFLRAVMTAVLLAQSFGIAPADELTLTPFENINTSMDLKDDPAHNRSLYQVEVFRVNEFGSLIQNAAKKGEKVFIVVDEMLRGTPAEFSECLCRAYNIKQSKFDNVLSIISSHNADFIDNAISESNGKTKLIFVESIVDKDGFYAGSTKKILEGKSHMDSAFYVAEKILSEENQDILAEAKKIYENKYKEKHRS